MERPIVIKTAAPKFTIVYNALLENKELDSSEKLLFILLKKFADTENKCFPSHDTLASLMNVSRRTVITKLQSLEKKGIVEVKRRTTKKGQTSNLYILREDLILSSDLKEKSSNPIPTKVQELEPKEVVHTKTTTIYNTTEKAMERQEKYSMNFLKEHYEYVHLANDICIKREVDSIMDIIYDIVNSSKKTVHIDGEDKELEYVKSRILNLDITDIRYVIEQYKNQKTRITKPKAYIIRLLYEARGQHQLDVVNQVQCDMYRRS